MASKDDLKALIRDIEKLQIAHERTGKIIETLTEKVRSIQLSNSKVNERSFTLEESRYLIGRRVRILNPAKHEPNIGTILSVGKVFITVDLGEGLRRNRTAKNIRIIE